MGSLDHKASLVLVLKKSHTICTLVTLPPAVSKCPPRWTSSPASVTPCAVSATPTGARRDSLQRLWVFDAPSDAGFFFFHVFVRYLYFFFWELSIKVLCLFLGWTKCLFAAAFFTIDIFLSNSTLSPCCFLMLHLSRSDNTYWIESYRSVTTFPQT